MNLAFINLSEQKRLIIKETRGLRLIMKHNLDLGQHFMIDETLLNKIIIEANINKNDVVLEVGLGEGALTKKLLSKNLKKVICVEQDERFFLKHELLELVYANVLEELETFVFTKLVANIPYHISEPLFIQLFAKKPQKIVVVCGLEFANKLMGKSIIGFIFQTCYEIKKIQDVQPSSFNPQPKVMSALISLDKKEPTVLFNYLSDFYEFSKTKLKNYLLKKIESKMTKNELKAKFTLIDACLLEKKLYELSESDFLKIVDFIKSELL